MARRDRPGSHEHRPRPPFCQARVPGFRARGPCPRPGITRRITFSADVSRECGVGVWRLQLRGHNPRGRGIISPLLRSWSVRSRRARMAWIGQRRRQSRFETVVLPHLDAGYALARWLTRNDADAADVVQEACLRAFRYFDGYRDGDAKSWLLKIVRRTSYDWLERNRPGDLVPLDTEAEADGRAPAIPGTAVDADALLQSRSDLRRLDHLIEALPAPLREAIVLRELHEL